MTLFNHNNLANSNGHDPPISGQPSLFPINDSLFVTDPLLSLQGRKILQKGIGLIYAKGLEGMDLSMLAEKMRIPEEEVFTFFDSKYQLMGYLHEYYWNSVFQLEVPSARLKLQVALECLCHEFPKISTIREPYMRSLFYSLVREPLKQEVFTQPDFLYSGLFWGYAKLLQMLSETIIEINPEYPYPHNLALSLVECIKQHTYFTHSMPIWSTYIGEKPPKLSPYVIDLALRVLLE